MVKIKIYNRENNVICVLSLKSGEKEIDYKGEGSDFVKHLLEEEYDLLENGNYRKLSMKDPLDLLLHLFIVISGSAIRASMPIFENEESGEVYDEEKNISDEEENGHSDDSAKLEKGCLSKSEEIEKSIEIKAPEKVPSSGKKIFLAGSIDMGEAEDWQTKLSEALKDENIVILNPRRDDWDSSWKQDIKNLQFRTQVEWELENQEDADIIAMYIDPKSKAPITLLELGLFADSDKIILLCPEGFYRKGNVDIVVERYGIEGVENWDDFVEAIKARIDKEQEDIYKYIDNILKEKVYFQPDKTDEKQSNIQKMAHLIPSSIQLAKGTKKIAEEAELELYRSLRDHVNDWFKTINKSSDPDEVVSDLKLQLHKWAKSEKKQMRNSLQQLYDRGMEAGIKQTGIDVKKQVKKVDYVIYRDTGLAKAIERLRDESYENLSSITKSHFHGKDGFAIYRNKRDIDSWLRQQRYQTRRMLKTEVSRISQWGTLKAWDVDDDKYKYNYFWNIIDDKGTKDISKMRNEGNPYSYDEASFLFHHMIQKMGTKFQDDTFNNRCWITREPVEYENKSNRFFGQEFNYRRTLPDV